MKFRTTLLAVGAGVLTALAAPVAGHASSDVAVVSVLFTDHCDHTVTVTVANVTDKAGVFQLNEEPTTRTVPAYDNAAKRPGTATVERAVPFVNDRGEDVVRVRLLAGTKLGGGAGTDRAVHGWSKPADCAEPGGPGTGGAGGGKGDDGKAAPPAQQPVPVAAEVSYRNCTEVRAAGKAPIYPGQPGFQPKFDRDNDGIGCETGGQDETQAGAIEQAEELPLTGPSAWWYAAGGAVVLALGAGLVRAGRRRKVTLKA